MSNQPLRTPHGVTDAAVHQVALDDPQRQFFIGINPEGRDEDDVPHVKKFAGINGRDEFFRGIGVEGRGDEERPVRPIDGGFVGGVV